MAVLEQYNWIIGLISVAFTASCFGNGANDVANSYATSIAARSLTMPQVGFLSMITEFVGAVALGARVTSTIKNGIIDIQRFDAKPSTLMLAMGCAEFGSAGWLVMATKWGLPVSTSQTVVGALVGVGFATKAPIKWGWGGGSVSQVAASWAIAPMASAVVSAAIFGSIKYAVHERKDPLKWGLRLIPFYLALTAAVLSLFIIVELPTMDSFDEFGVGKMCGIVLGVFGGCFIIAYTFLLPYFHRRLIRGDARVRSRHVILGPLLWKDDPWIPFPGSAEGEVVTDYYATTQVKASTTGSLQDIKSKKEDEEDTSLSEKGTSSSLSSAESDIQVVTTRAAPSSASSVIAAPASTKPDRMMVEPEDYWLRPYKHLPLYNRVRAWNLVKFVLLQGVSRDCVSHDSARLAQTHARAKKYDNRVEHLWMYAQVASAMVMSIAHGSNDVANAVGPWVAAYETYRAGRVETDTETPIWILVVAGFLLGAGFWFYGYHIVRALGNKITQLSPSRGFSMELGAGLTVLVASRLGLPVSTTQCLTGATLGTALMNYDLGSVSWPQVLFIFSGWIVTLPVAALVSGLLCLMALNTPHF